MRTQKELGAFIREWRKSQKLSQTELGERLGISQGYVSQMEQGEAFSTLGLLCDVAELMGLTLDELAGRSRNGTAPKPTDDTRTLHRILDTILSTPPDERVKLLTFLELYSKEP